MRTILMTMMIAALGVTVYGDIAKPNNNLKGKLPEPVETFMDVKLDPDAKFARLVIPLQHVRALRAQLDAIEGGGENTAAVTSGGFTRTQTIMSGLFISIAIGLGGVWFMRTGRLSTRNGKAVAVGVVLFVGGAFATIVYGNAGVPAEARSITGKMFAPAVHVYKSAGGAVTLEVSNKVDDVLLVVPDPQEPKKADE